MTGYTRQSAASITPSAEIAAGPLNDEFDQLQAAFDLAGGHTHDATTGNGPKISLTGSVTGILPEANGGTGVTSISAFVTLTGSQVLTNKTLTDPVINVRDSGLRIQDNSDATKQLAFEVSGITTATTRTLTVIDADMTLVGLTNTQTLTNKTLSSPTLSGTMIGGTVNPTTLQQGGVQAVTTTGSQTLTNKTLTTPTISAGYTEGTFTSNTGTALTIDLANGSVQILTLTGNCTYTFPTAVAGKSFLLVQKQNGSGSNTVVWPAAVKWPGSVTPVITAAASKADLYAFTSDGTNWYGRTIGKAYL